MPRLEGNVVVFDENDWKHGLVPNESSGLLARGNGELAYGDQVNPFRNPYAAQPYFNASLATNYAAALAGTVVAGVNKNSSTAYLLDDGGSVQELTLATNTLTNAGSFPHAIDHGHSGEAGSDAILYKHNLSGTARVSMFYSFNDGTDWDVGTYGDLEGTPAFDDDFLTTVPASPLGGSSTNETDGKGFPHPMAIGADGILYIGDRHFIHAYDGSNGSNGTVEEEVLDFPTGFITTSFLATERYLIAFAYKPPVSSASIGTRGEAKAFYWDYVDPNSFQFSEDLDDNYCVAAFAFRGLPSVFTFGRYGGYKRGKLRVKEGGRWRVKAYLDDYPVNRGVTMVGEQAVFETTGDLFAYGGPDESDPLGLHRIASLSGTSRGMVGQFSTNSLHVSSGTYLDELKTGYSQASLQTKQLVVPMPESMQAKIQYVRVFFLKAASGGRSLDLDLVTDGRNTTTAIFSTKTTVTAGQLITDYQQDENGTPFPSFSDIGLDLTWGAGSGSTDSPAVVRVEVHLDSAAIVNQQ